MKPLLLLTLCFVTASTARGETPVPLIFDTDIGNDCDDVLALGMIHALQSRGECDLLAVTITKDHPLAAAFTDAVNTFYGRPDIPIGVCRSGVTPQVGKFNILAAEKSGDDYRYPHDLISGNDARDAVDVLREQLATADDGTVVIAQVGFSTNLINLMDSPSDQHSDLVGKELIKQKVKLINIMAGAFKQIVGNSGDLYDHKEYNVVKDIPAAKRMATEWPTPIIWSGFEIGKNLPYPHQSVLRDYGYVQHHPLAEAYTLYNPPPHDRPTWDLTSVLQSVRPGHEYFDLSPMGNVTVTDDGLTMFQADASGNDQYLIIPEDGADRITESLTLLSSEPPSR